MSWELDVWKKLRNAKKSSVMKYLSSIESKNFLEIINQNVENQTIALTTVKLQKESAKANQLAVNRFEALLLHTKNLQYELQQRVVETENKLKFILHTRNY